MGDKLPVSDERLQLLPEITRQILAVSQPQKIILFGSFAHGDYGPDSELDLLVIMDAIESLRAESNRLRRALRGYWRRSTS